MEKKNIIIIWNVEKGSQYSFCVCENLVVGKRAMGHLGQAKLASS